MPAKAPSPAAKTLSAPQKALIKLGLKRDIDLALHLPLRYEDETRIVKLRDAREGDTAQIEATVPGTVLRAYPVDVGERQAVDLAMAEALVDLGPPRRVVISAGMVELGETSGIAPEDQPKLFQKFAQLKAGKAKGGTGLGLSISKVIIEAHGGQIGMRNATGGGSVFWFRLPGSAPNAPIHE